MRALLVTGVPGVGKTTVSGRAAALLGIQSWDYADLMLQVAPEIQGKDDLPSLSWADRVGIYRRVDVLLAEIFRPGDNDCVLLENHLSVVDHGTLRTFPHKDIRRYQPAGLAVIESAPDVVIDRRQRDPNRHRHPGSPAEVAIQQNLNRRQADEISTRYQLPTTTISNQDTETAATELATWAERIMS